MAYRIQVQFEIQETSKIFSEAEIMVDAAFVGSHSVIIGWSVKPFLTDLTIIQSSGILTGLGKRSPSISRFTLGQTVTKSRGFY
jgi:hypothetical protein